jgi:hypothetical protein
LIQQCHQQESLRHSRAGGNPVGNVHPELVEGFIKKNEWFDTLTITGIYFTGFPPARE